MAKPKKPKLGSMPKSKNPAVIKNAMIKKIDRVKDYQKKLAQHEKDTKEVARLKTEFTKLKAKLT